MLFYAAQIPMTPKMQARSHFGRKIMEKHSNTDKAINNIMQWADRSAWSDEQAQVFEDHVHPVCERLGICIRRVQLFMSDPKPVSGHSSRAVATRVSSLRF